MAAIPLRPQVRRLRNVECNTWPCHDDEMRQIEQLAPAVPRGKTEKRVGPDDQRKGTRRFFRPQFFERFDGIARPLTEDFARVDFEPGIAGDGELDHGKAMVGRGDGNMPVGRIAGRDQSYRGKRQGFIELACELEMTAVNRVERAPENPECAIGHGGQSQGRRL